MIKIIKTLSLFLKICKGMYLPFDLTKVKVEKATGIYVYKYSATFWDQNSKL